jgi:hypothetical protein
VLLEAEQSDAGQMLGFLRWLDRDCDGRVSEADFGNVVSRTPCRDEVAGMDERWQQAACAMEADAAARSSAQS